MLFRSTKKRRNRASFLLYQHINYIAALCLLYKSIFVWILVIFNVLSVSVIDLSFLTAVNSLFNFAIFLSIFVDKVLAEIIIKVIKFL